MVSPTFDTSASNDAAFRASRGRTVPIPETLTPVPGYPDKLRIYRIRASRFWQVRCFFAGKTYSRSLRTTSMKTALDLARLSPAGVRARWGVVLERTVRELQGTPCMDIEDVPSPKQQIACTRSFGQPVLQLADLREAVTEFACRAAQKLRRQNSHAGQVLVFVRTSPFRATPQYSQSVIMPLRRPGADSGHITQAALAALEAIYQPGYLYAKAGVMLMDLQPARHEQMCLALGENMPASRHRLMTALDNVNHRFGRGTLHLASAGTAGKQRHWEMKQARKTPGYTTDWKALVVCTSV